MEKLIALCGLRTFCPGAENGYCEELDSMFLEDPENDFLLELENLGNDCLAVWARLEPFMLSAEFNVDKFGKALFTELEQTYAAFKITFRDFTMRCYRLWSRLPDSFRYDEPFYILCEASDYPYDFDVDARRELYRKAFDFYKRDSERKT